MYVCLPFFFKLRGASESYRRFKKTMESKKQIRPNKVQVRMLLEYMREHRDFAAGKFPNGQGQAHLLREWVALKDLLNEHGPVRSLEQWKLTWRDQKSKARKEGGAHHQALQKTGNTEVPELSDNSALVLDTIGKETAVGLGRPESGIGFSPKSPSQSLTETHSHEKSQSKSHEHDYASTQTLSLMQASTSQQLRKRKRKAPQPPERFLNVQLQQNEIFQNQLQSLNLTLAAINATLLNIQTELHEANGLRREQSRQGHSMDQEVEIEYEEV